MSTLVLVYEYNVMSTLVLVYDYNVMSTLVLGFYLLGYLKSTAVALYAQCIKLWLPFLLD